MLDYANAMVPARQPTTAAAIANWQEHVDGKRQYAPPIPPLAPAKFTGSLYIAEGNKAFPWRRPAGALKHTFPSARSP